MKKILLAVIAIFVFLLVVLLFNMMTFSSRQLAEVAPVQIDVPGGGADRLAGAIQLPTISANGWVDTAAMFNLHAYLDTLFPQVEAALSRETVNDLSLLYHWKGTNPELKPVVLIGHMDVVPPDSATLDQWIHPPFSGRVDTEFIWGRGTMDDKSSVVGILEAINLLIESGHQPERSLWIGFGHDEEIGGREGALMIANLLKERGVEAEFVLDEGGFVIPGVVPGVAKPTVLIGIAEKGGVNLSFTCKGAGGHSSMPPKQTAVGILSAAIARLEANPFPAKMGGTINTFFDYAGPEMEPGFKLVFANSWLFRPVIQSILEAKHTTNASIRTTTAVTVIRGGVKPNVLPSEASAIANFRIIPGETAESVLAYVREVVADDRVEIEISEFITNPSVVSDPESLGFRQIQQTAMQVFGDVVVTPYLVVGNTDARHFQEVSPQLFRFLPLQINSEDLPRMHGMDERIPVEQYHQAIRFYYQLLKTSLAANS